MTFDPVCTLHGMKWSEHEYGKCLYCCICFITLTLDTCHTLPDGTKEDICNDCAKEEELLMDIHC